MISFYNFRNITTMSNSQSDAHRTAVAQVANMLRRVIDTDDRQSLEEYHRSIGYDALRVSQITQVGIQTPSPNYYIANFDGDELFTSEIGDFGPDQLNIIEFAEPEDIVPETFPVDIEAEPECPVCQEGSNLLILGCRHTICDPCIRKLPKKTCPKCREPITMSLVRKRREPIRMRLRKRK